MGAISQNQLAKKSIVAKCSPGSDLQGADDDAHGRQPIYLMKPAGSQNTDKNELRQALSRFATGVTIVTSVDADAEPVGITANSFSSVSLEPPMVLWSLSDTAYSKKAFLSASHFCVHVLTAEQQALSERFACAGAEKFAGLDWTRGLGSVPLLKEFVARFQCRNTAQHRAGDHVIFIGEVLQYEQNDKRPLVFQGGRYALAERRMIAEIACHVGERRKTFQERRTPARKRYAD